MVSVVELSGRKENVDSFVLRQGDVYVPFVSICVRKVEAIAIFDERYRAKLPRTRLGIAMCGPPSGFWIWPCSAGLSGPAHSVTTYKPAALPSLDRSLTTPRLTNLIT